MSSVPTASVLLPVWNGEQYLAEAVESVLAQSFEPIELLIVDDGSTDATPDLACAFARRDARVRVIPMERRGLGHALNAGIALARGRYVARMDADDFSHPTRLEKQIAFLETNPECVAVGSAIEVVDESGAPVGTSIFPEDHLAIVDTLLHRRGTAVAHPTVVVRREAYVAVGGYRPEWFPAEDLDLWFRLSRIGRLANLREPLLRYRRHRGSVGSRERGRQMTKSLSILNEARRDRGMPPLPPPLRSEGGRKHVANYHSDCARTALTAGRRATAARHAGACIAAEPSWLEPWFVLAACALPRPALRYLLARTR